MTHVVSIVSLTIVMACCLFAVFSKGYRDNWFQFWGLVGVLFWSTARLAWVIEGHEVSGLMLLGHVALASFAVGEAYHHWDKWRHSHPENYHVGNT